jgi:copper(I)-binding protein
MRLRHGIYGLLRQRSVLLGSIVLILATGVLAACQSETPIGPDLRAEDVWARPAVAMGESSMSAGSEAAPMGHASAGTGAVFMKLVNTGSEADRLVGAQTDAAEVAEIHETTLQGDVMKMQMLSQGLEIPAEAEVVLKPGSYHIMLIGITRDLKVGDQISLVLEFEKSAPMTVDAKVQEP